ncbi:histidine phosphatase family protein [Ruminococcaceae bacterium OttesenSCG-928-L11]|nr:histidine phosphatase family protein [Ruminococcaceae bacterium OttesenSCG-928-L11]
MITYKIHLIRTGKTSDGPWKRYVGQSDLPLCDKGREGLEELKKEFQYPKVEMVYTSPLSRCVETADILFPDLYTVKVDGLMDMNLGEFEGKTFDELRDNDAFSQWLKNSFQNTPPGGEETEAFTKRIIHALSTIFINMMEEKVTNVAVVTHGGVIMTLLAGIGLPKLPLHQWAVANGSGYTLLMTPQMWMRDHAAEVFGHLPEPRTEDDMDVYGLYYND